MSLFEFILPGIGVGALLFGAVLAATHGWSAIDEAVERRRRRSERLLELLERIEANTAALAAANQEQDPSA